MFEVGSSVLLPQHDKVERRLTSRKFEGVRENPKGLETPGRVRRHSVLSFLLTDPKVLGKPLNLEPYVKGVLLTTEPSFSRNLIKLGVTRISF